MMTEAWYLLCGADGVSHVRRVLLLATTTGYQIRSFGEAAEKLGVRLVFASDRCDQLEDPWWDQAIPIRFQQEDVSVETVTRALAVAPPEGILAVGDRPVVVAARIAEALGLPGHSPAAASVSRSKLASRRAFKAAGLATPSFDTCGLDADAAARRACHLLPRSSEAVGAVGQPRRHARGR